MGHTDSSADKRVTGTSERRELIIQRLRQQGSVQVSDLSVLFGVSTVTIRNDLAFLEKQGIAVRAYGGALICDSNTSGIEPSVEDKSSLNTALKRSIARAAVELIKPGHRVILDSGTTTYEIARLMRKHTDVIAMTNGMNVANALLEAEGVELLMTGGHLRRQSLSFYGDQAEHSLQNYHFDMLFLGVDAIDLERGISTHNEDEARLNRRMCEVAERIIVVTDSSKFDRSSLHKIIDTQRIDMIIVDEGIPVESLEGLRKSGIDVILVKI
ncbi:DeoR family transcriptional regulator [Salmonella enterica subsp. diarizonae]|uniref:DNA-binding transcriptional regulator AgaR n=8 Tax=Salmonella enterica TaxID=28901 RepID=A0A447QY61_SALER|nr:DeoR family transcriptional regulator [Salmonella enterica]AXC67326.1 DeoR family transcriptional regulator [Salmonella enterica subsp. diarizonae serovar 59:z10:-]EAA7929499.1 DeoR family transcriptional regulator [Salmonella enterica subsp. enterica serovar Redlands]EBE3719314.1 DeoR family transcriptional regulator [Salmonella enterica subsp. diarizonae serovar 42:l,v:1,5,7]EBH8035370.1 DeoR family transcriptional regulator [Salmonella bongori]EBH8353538.1 DeoR family transcriptional reg